MNVYENDRLVVQDTTNHDILPPFALAVTTGRAFTQTYLTREQLAEHVAECQALLA